MFYISSTWFNDTDDASLCEIVFVDILLADVADEVTKQLHVHLHTY